MRASGEDAPAALVSNQEVADITSVNIDVSDREASLLATNQALRERNIALYTHLRETEQEYAEAWSSREAEYEAKIGSLERRLEEQQETVESAKAAASLIMEQNRSYALSDDEVTMWFNARARGWYEWAKEAAHREFDLIREKYEDIRAQSQIFVTEQNGDIPEELWRTKPKSIPYLLLHGMVSNFICTEIFKNPFWILGALPRESEGMDTSTSMQEAVAELNEALLQCEWAPGRPLALTVLIRSSEREEHTSMARTAIANFRHGGRESHIGCVQSPTRRRAC